MTRALRPIRIDGDVAYITLTKGYEAVIDVADVHLVAGRNWGAREILRKDGSTRVVYAESRARAQNSGQRGVILMHRVIAGTPCGMHTDHINCDGVDNRRSNLRVVTRCQNAHNARRRSDNTSGAKGITWHGPTGKWQARIRVNGKEHYLGLFSDIASASEEYGRHSKELHGQFGRTS